MSGAKRVGGVARGLECRPRRREPTELGPELGLRSRDGGERGAELAGEALEQLAVRGGVDLALEDAPRTEHRELGELGPELLAGAVDRLLELGLRRLPLALGLGQCLGAGLLHDLARARMRLV
ncbi:MAG: hypothetical protein RMM29_09965, partial [Planctomycetota bacterium]|nr:hypothetical protein [Planctomycetota bacterium]